MGEGGEISDAVLPENVYHLADCCDRTQAVVAATLITADLVREATLENLDLFATAVSDRDPQQLPILPPFVAAAEK